MNHERKKFTKELSLLSRPQVSIGSRLHPKNRNVYFFAAVAYNIYQSESGELIESLFEKTSGESGGIQHWPGFSAGILVQ